MSVEAMSNVCQSKYLDVLGSRMHYIEAGSGDPILFLHGIPTSCYLWRNVIPHLANLGHCIAPDLIGLGKSDKPNIDYTIQDHIRYIEKFIETLGLKNITIVMHGWGSLIGFSYATNHENNCKGLVFYESFLRAMNGDDISLPYQEQLQALQGLDSAGSVEGVSYIDKIIPLSVLGELSDAQMDAYREPFLLSGAEKPIKQFIRELPKGDGHSSVDQLIKTYTDKLTRSSLPKLMLYSVPGFITTIATAMWAKENLPHLELIDIGEELHLAQESYPELMGKTISVWLQGIEQQSTRGVGK